MSPLTVLALTASLSLPPSAPPALERAIPSLAAQVTALAGDAGAKSVATARATRVPPGGDSLQNGAITGAVLAGGGLLIYASRFCRETSCAPDALMWAALAGGLGALIGAGIDALFTSDSSGRL